MDVDNANAMVVFWISALEPDGHSFARACYGVKNVPPLITVNNQ